MARDEAELEVAEVAIKTGGVDAVVGAAEELAAGGRDELLLTPHVSPKIQRKHHRLSTAGAAAAAEAAVRSASAKRLGRIVICESGVYRGVFVATSHARCVDAPYTFSRRIVAPFPATRRSSCPGTLLTRV